MKYGYSFVICFSVRHIYIHFLGVFKKTSWLVFVHSRARKYMRTKMSILLSSFCTSYGNTKKLKLMEYPLISFHAL
jgi:hypothetical protein